MSIQITKLPILDPEKQFINKIDNVKTSPERQVKVRSLHLRVCQLLCAFSFVASHLNGAEMNDSVFVNANIYTVNERQPHAEAVAVKSGRIVFVGSEAD